MLRAWGFSIEGGGGGLGVTKNGDFPTTIALSASWLHGTSLRIDFEAAVMWRNQIAAAYSKQLLSRVRKKKLVHLLNKALDFRAQKDTKWSCQRVGAAFTGAIEHMTHQLPLILFLCVGAIMRSSIWVGGRLQRE